MTNKLTTLILALLVSGCVTPEATARASSSSMCSRASRCGSEVDFEICYAWAKTEDKGDIGEIPHEADACIYALARAACTPEGDLEVRRACSTN